MAKFRNTITILLFFFSLTLFSFLCVILKAAPDRLIGAAFCHQIPSRSPMFNFPFCYRCSGLFFGIFTGALLTLCTKSDGKIITKQLSAGIIISFLLYIMDILNSSKFPGIHLYTEKVLYRFLSAYPIGFFTARLITGILKKILTLENRGFEVSNQIKVLTFIIVWILSSAIITGNQYFLYFISRFLLSITCILFLSSLYTILIQCIVLLRNRSLSFSESVISGITLGLLHISLLGYIHLHFFRFEDIFL